MNISTATNAPSASHATNANLTSGHHHHQAQAGSRRSRRSQRSEERAGAINVPVPVSKEEQLARLHLRVRGLNEPPVILVMTRAEDDEVPHYNYLPPRLPARRTRKRAVVS
jgi:hypothetical protein